MNADVFKGKNLSNDKWQAQMPKGGVSEFKYLDFTKFFQNSPS
jgi:hypothetical protein